MSNGISLEAARVNAKLTLKEAAKALGISVSTLLSYEKGRTSPTIETVKKIESLYNVGYSDLIFLP